jgi:1-deoxy-D-xylulose-5-phosphate synthase
MSGTAAILPRIGSPADLKGLSERELERLAREMRAELIRVVGQRPAHFASNLGVVELCLALHLTFDFSQDRIIWDTGHQIYPHKLLTGRADRLHTIRTKGGLMGYPNPHESEYDLFMTGHAGSSVSTVLGLQSGDLLMKQADRRAVAVIGDGAFPSGIVFEALNNAGGLKSDVIVVLNDNKMSICPRVGGVASYLDRLRSNPLYTGFKTEMVKMLNKVPLFGDPAERFLAQFKEAVKCGLHGGMMFEDLGFRYFGPIDGHDVAVLRKYLKMVKELKGPILLHVVTEKGHGYQPAACDPVYFHTPPAFVDDNGQPIVKKSGGGVAYTNLVSGAIRNALAKDERVTVLTAAMCQGNKLEPVRDEFPTRFFDTGICESHAVAFAGGQAKAGLRPIVDIYSTFLQRSYDQVFQEVALQDLPVVFTMDRAGLTGPDGPTHHGAYDIAYMRCFPNMICLAPGDEHDVAPMLDFALAAGHPVSIRYPKANAERIAGERTPVELGKAETLRTGEDGTILCCGTLLADCLRAADQLREEGLDVGVVNMRFIKPIDREAVAQAACENRFLVTVEEGCLQGGFGAAVLETLADLQLRAGAIRRLGLPDRFIEHGERHEVLAELGLDVAGIARACREAAGALSPVG